MTLPTEKRGRASPRRRQSPPPPQSLPQKVREHPLWSILVLAVAIMGALASLMTVLDEPFWATGPEVHVVSSDVQQPFAAFDAVNRSFLYPTKVLDATCRFKELRMRGGDAFFDLRVGAIYADGTILPRGERPFYCSIHASLGAFVALRWGLAKYLHFPSVHLGRWPLDRR
jgi:hypothetical protein